MKVKILSVFLSFLVIALPVKSFAIIPLLIPLAAGALEIAVGQFAAAGVARLVNPVSQVAINSSSKLSIPGIGGKRWVVSLAAATVVIGGAGSLLFSKLNRGGNTTKCMPVNGGPLQSISAIKSNYVASRSGNGHTFKWSGGVKSSSANNISPLRVSYYSSTGMLFESRQWYCYIVTSKTYTLEVHVPSDIATSGTNADQFVVEIKAIANEAAAGSSTSAQASSLLSSLVSASGTPANQGLTKYPDGSISSVSNGVVTVTAGNGVQTIDANNKLLMGGAVGTLVPVTGAGSGAGAGSGPGPGAGAGSGPGAGAGLGLGDLSGVISAVNANNLSITSSVNSAASQATIDANAIADKLDILNKKCVLNPDLVECKDLGTFNTASHNFGNGITSADTFSSIYTKHNASWTASSIGSTITRLFPSTGVSGYPVWSINLSGTTLTLDMANYSTFFSMLGSLVLVLAGFQSIKIILGRD